MRESKPMSERRSSSSLGERPLLSFSELSRSDQTGALVRAIQELSLARSLPEIQQIVRVAARRLTGADGATFVLRDGERCYYADEDAISPLWKGQRFRSRAASAAGRCSTAVPR